VKRFNYLRTYSILMGLLRSENKGNGKALLVRRCPICFSARNDLFLGGKFSPQVYKCLDCGYVGAVFVEFEEKWVPPSKNSERDKKDKDECQSIPQNFQ